MKPYHLAPLVGGLLSFGAPAVAQIVGSTAAPADPPAQIDPFPGSPVQEEKRFNLELPADLPAEEAIALVAKQAGQPVNVIWTGDSAQTPLPALRLHQVSIHPNTHVRRDHLGRNTHRCFHPLGGPTVRPRHRNRPLRRGREPAGRPATSP